MALGLGRASKSCASSEGFLAEASGRVGRSVARERACNLFKWAAAMLVQARPPNIDWKALRAQALSARTPSDDWFHEAKAKKAPTTNPQSNKERLRA